MVFPLTRTLIIGTLLVLLAPGSGATQDRPDFEVAAGVLGAFGGNFIDQPDDLRASAGSDDILLVYPGFGGPSLGGGFFAELRYAGVVGLEVDVLYSRDRGSGFIDNVRIEIGQDALHVPIILKGIYPGKRWRPGFGLGLDLVFPSALAVSTDPVLPSDATLFGATAGSYTMLLFTGHLEISLPLDSVDLRVPIGLRFGLNPSTPDSARERADYTLGGSDGRLVTSVVFSSQWAYQFHATTGLSIHF